MAHVEYIPQRNADGTVIFRGIVVGRGERLRRLLRRLLRPQS